MKLPVTSWLLLNSSSRYSASLSFPDKSIVKASVYVFIVWYMISPVSALVIDTVKLSIGQSNLMSNIELAMDACKGQSTDERCSIFFSTFSLICFLVCIGMAKTDPVIRMSAISVANFCFILLSICINMLRRYGDSSTNTITRLNNMNKLSIDNYLIINGENGGI